MVATNSMYIKVFELATWDCEILYGHTDIVLSVDVFTVGNLFVSSGKVCLNILPLLRLNRNIKELIDKFFKSPVLAFYGHMTVANTKTVDRLPLPHADVSNQIQSTGLAPIVNGCRDSMFCFIVSFGSPHCRVVNATNL